MPFSDRRTFLRQSLLLNSPGLGCALASASPLTQAKPRSPAAMAAAPALSFPRDFGSHPEQAIEWWYITGSASSGGRLFGYQLTFFRARVRGNEGLRSAFAAKQLILAHAAVTDLQGQRLWHEQRSARLGMGLSRASEQDTDVGLHPWTLQRDALPNGSRYRARLSSEHFSLLLDFQSTQPLLLQGQQGLSQKGPDALQFSRYYSETQMTVQGEIQLQGQRFPLDPPSQQPRGRAWLDHEWSDQLMAPQAQGWDWLGMNLFDGRSLMAFRMRGRDGTTIWDAATWRDSDGRVHSAPQGSTEWRPGARWKSPRTQAEYPVEWQLNCPLGQFHVKAMLADQELDSRSSTGNVYWEGLSELFNAEGVCIGRGYVELTGYSEALRLG